MNALAFDKSTHRLLHYNANHNATDWGTAKQLAYTDSDISGNADTATALTSGNKTIGGNLTVNGNVTASMISASHQIASLTGSFKKAYITDNVASNIAAGPTLRVSKGATGVIGDIRYDTFVIEANDVATIRIGESDGTVSSIMSGDSNMRINSTHPMKFFTAGSTTGEAHGGQGGTLALTLDNSQDATFAGNVLIADNKNLDFGAATDFRIVHNSTTNVNHVSSKLDRQLSINANIINLTNQANDDTVMRVSGSRVGIGTTSPGEKLEVVGNISASGNLTGLSGSLSVLGVGTTTPAATVQIVDGGLSGDNTLNLNNRVKFRGDGVIFWGASANFGLLNWSGNDTLIGAQTGKNLNLYANNSSKMFISASGNVGIGVTDPDAKLEIKGTTSDSNTYNLSLIHI